LLYGSHTHGRSKLPGSLPTSGCTRPKWALARTRTLEVIELLVRAPWRAIEPREAVLFSEDRRGEAHVAARRGRRHVRQGPQGGTRKQPWRGIINAGNQRGASIPRAEDFGRKLTDFPIFCPKTLAGIGHTLPATVIDRSIKIPMVPGPRPSEARGTSVETSRLLLMSFARDCPWPKRGHVEADVLEDRSTVHQQLASRTCWSHLRRSNVATGPPSGWVGKVT
jgi:hypothetical protein